jgi:hypothetical protein
MARVGQEHDVSLKVPDASIVVETLLAIDNAPLRRPQLHRMLERHPRVLQLNMMKPAPSVEALINGHQSQTSEVLLIEEGSISTYRTYSQP